MFYQIFQEEFELLLKKINSAADSPTALFGGHLLESKGRDQAFRIEGLARLLFRNTNISKKKRRALEKLMRHAKAFEDILGKMDEVLALEKNVVGHSKKVIDPRPLIRSQSALAKEIGLNTFGSKKWIKKQLSAVSFLKKGEPKESLKIAREAIANEIEDLIEKTTTELLPNLQKSSFGYDAMEDYYHEFRRILRWIPIYVQTLPIFELTPFAPEEYPKEEKQILQKYKGNPFTEIDSKHARISLDRFSFYMFSHTIARSGLIKDGVEMHFKLKELKLKTTLNADKYKREMIRSIEDFLKSGAAWRLYDSVLKNKVDKK